MEREEIKVWIKEYIESRIHITIDEEISLLDPRNGLLPRDLLQLFFAMEKQFGIEFKEQNVLDTRFDYLKNIVMAVQEELKNNRAEKCHM